MQRTRARLKPPFLETVRNTSVVMRLSLGFGVLLLLLVAVGAVGWLAAGSLSRSAQGLVALDHQQAKRVATLEKAVAEMALATTAVSLTDDQQDIAYEVKRLKLGLQAYAATAAELEAAEQAVADPRVGELTAAVRDARTTTTGLMEQIAGKAEAGVARETLADFVATQLRLPQDAWFKRLAALNQTVDERMLAHAADAERLALRVQALLAATSALAVALGLGAAVLISRSVSRPLRSAVALAQSVSQGDLSQALPAARKDEFGVLFGALGEMQASLRHIVGDIRVAANGIQSASTEVAGGNADLSQRTETTAAQLQQAAASMQQLGGSLQLGSGAAQSAKSLAAEAAHAARSGGAVVQEVVGNMASIADSSRRIADITGVIDGIAFQTNLLALNAAVEAARAGEQGRGFAVVAGEVRTLAHRAAAAAREIKVLIGASSDKVAAGSQLVQGAGSTMAKIVVAVQRLAQAVTEISDAATRQSQDVAAVGQVVNEIDTMTQQNAALVEQSSAAAAMLAEQAERMNALIGTFRLAADFGVAASPARA